MVTSAFGTCVDGSLRDDFLMPLVILRLFIVRRQAAYLIFTYLVTYLNIFYTNIHGSQTTNGSPLNVCTTVGWISVNFVHTFLLVTG